MDSKILVEKWRPKTFDEVVGNSQVVEKLRSIKDVNKMPHLLLEGMPGVGKTSIAYVLAHFFYGKDININFLELNASDDRGIEVVRSKIKDFAKTKGLSTDKKMILLDEADSLTQECQNALRRVMEQYVNTCVFIMSCNYVQKIIDPIKSRCLVCHFNPIKEEEMIGRLKRIIYEEHILINETVLKELIKQSCGDMRRVINDLQSLSFLGREITLQDIKSVGIDFGELFGYIDRKLFSDARSFINEQLNRGIDPRRLLVMMREWVFTNTQNGKILEQLMLADYRIIEGVEVDLVFDGLIWRCLG